MTFLENLDLEPLLLAAENYAAAMFAAGQDPYLAVSEGKIFEAATRTCAHCGTPVIMNPNRIRPRGHCRKCDRYICDSPACNLECTPVDKTLDHFQEQAFRKEAGYNLLPLLTSVSPLMKG